MIIDLSALVGVPDLPYLVYSIDHPGMIDRLLPAGFHWRFRGRWAAACTANDVLAMGARPVGLALDVALPAKTPVSAVREFYQGVTDVLTAYGTELDGGNIDANERFETAAVCWGVVSPAGIIRRRGARAGDHVAVTTEPGLGWAGYLLTRLGHWEKLSRPARAHLKGYNLMPLAPHQAILETVRSLPGAITSGMDLTDGLVEFLHTIGELTGFGVVVDAAAVPVTPTLSECAALLGVPAQLLAIEYGYDTPRLHGFTVDPAQWDEVSRIWVRHGTPLYRIGEVTAEPRMDWRRQDGTVTRLPELWYDHYRGGDIVEQWFAVVPELASRSG
jgi:thiamine-monophosphate kinase